LPDFRAELSEAAQTGNLDRLRQLLGQNPGLASMPDESGYTALHYAAYFGHVDMARFLVGLGADLNAISMDPLRNTPLHAAASGGHLAIGELLLGAGADLEAKQTGDWTALHSAADRGHQSFAQMLVRRGASRMARSVSGKTAADLATEKGHTALAEQLRG
jgi:uncharacterized protein